MDQILKRDHPDVKANGRYFSCGVCYYAVEGGSTFEFVDAIQYLSTAMQSKAVDCCFRVVMFSDVVQGGCHHSF